MNALERLLQRLGKKPKNRPVVIAHRGASRVSPENTIPAFEIAIEDGADAVEFDVRLTSDRDLVVMHDARLGRTTLNSRLVASVTADDAAALDAGSWFNKEFRGALVPLLNEALTTLRERVVPLVEIKDSGPIGVAAAERLVAILEESEMSEDVIVISRFTEALDAVGRLSPDTPRAGVAARHASGLLALNSYDGCLVWWKSFGPALVETAREREGFVAPWVVPIDKAQEFAKAGANALVVDDPAGTIKRLRGSR